MTKTLYIGYAPVQQTYFLNDFGQNTAFEHVPISRRCEDPENLKPCLEAILSYIQNNDELKKRRFTVVVEIPKIAEKIFDDIYKNYFNVSKVNIERKTMKDISS